MMTECCGQVDGACPLFQFCASYLSAVIEYPVMRLSTYKYVIEGFGRGYNVV